MASKDTYTQLANADESENEEETKQMSAAQATENKTDTAHTNQTDKPTNIELQIQPNTAGAVTNSTIGDETKIDTEIPYEYKDVPLDLPFEELTTDISCWTKFKLLLWKNSKIQCIRYPKGLCLTYGIPVIMMLVLVALTTIEGLQQTHGDAHGVEYDYQLSNTGDAADFTTNYPMKNELPWPDASVAHKWIKYFICARNPFYPTQYDKHPPSYLAIVHPDITEDMSSGNAIDKLLEIMQKKYGDSSTYEQEFYDNALAEGTWYSHEDSEGFEAYVSNPTKYHRCWRHSNVTRFVNFTEGSLLKFFKTELELEEYVTNKTYSAPGFNFENDRPNATRPVGAAIVFNEVGGTDMLTWNYTLRINMSAMPDTNTPLNIFERNYNVLYSLGAYWYIEYNAFVQLQTWIDEAIMEYMIRYGNFSKNEAESPSTADAGVRQTLLDKFDAFTKEYSKGSFMFPTYGYLQNTYWTFVGIVFGFFMFIMFAYPITEILTILVDEKAKKIKETLNMMGATTATYWLSWYAWFFLQFTGISVVITVIGIFGNVFLYSQFGVIFVWFWLFCLSTGMMCCWMSTWFDNPKTASLIGVVLFLIFLSFGTLMTDSTNGEKHGICLIAPACFMLSIDNIVQYESGQIGIRWDNINDKYNDFAFSSCLYMMAIDIVIYMILNIYFDQVFPSKFGSKQVPWFFLLPDYWRQSNCCQSEALVHEKNELRRRITSVLDFGANYQHFVEDGEEAQLITIRDLTKTFKSGICSKRPDVRAVQGVSLDIYKGEIFCLLGHNGAGKTTTLSMLTGLIPITAGHAWILNQDIRDPSSMNEVRKHLGVCPQHDILWDRMSTEEHLWFFARLKGVPKEKTDAEVATMLKKTHLDRDHNKDKFPTQMSGGQRRKLSLGIALIGGSQIVFLDEPTSGMDPQNRRITWELIQSEKQNRSIILTTHFMDEADILGDRVAIMATGQVKCCGTNSFLKHSYGVGYTLTVSLNLVDDFDKKNVKSIKTDIDQIVFEHISKSEVVALAGSEITYRLPFESTSQFSTLFNLLDDNAGTLKVETYGISVTTLEEVFMKVGHDEIEPIPNGRSLSNLNSHDAVEHKEEKEALKPENIDGQIEEDTLDSFELSSMSRAAIFFYHIYAILYKRVIWNLRDKQALFCQLFCPVIISLFGFGIGAVTLHSLDVQPPMALHPTTWYPSADMVHIPTTNNNGSFPSGNESEEWWKIPQNFYEDNQTFYNVWADSRFDETSGDLLIKNTSIEVEEYFHKNKTNWKGWFLMPWGSTYPSTYGVTHTFQDWLLEQTRNDNDPRYLSFYFLPYSMTANQQKRVYFGVNGSALHAIPIANNLWNNWVLNYIFDGYLNADSIANISTVTHPLPPTYTQSLILQYFLAFQQSIYFVIAFSFIPAGAIFFIVNEKKCQTKHQQLVSGVSYGSYWIANYIMDVTAGYPAIILVICFIYIFNSFVYEDAIGWFIATLLLFLWSSTPFTYLLSFLFDSPSQAQFTTIMLYMVLGMVMGLVCLGMELMDYNSETSRISTDILRPIFRLFPPFIMCESLINIGIKIVLFPFAEFKDWEVLGRNFVFMFVEGIGYFLLVLVIEYLSTYPVLLRKCGLITNMSATQRDGDLDDDVWLEKQRIKEGITEVSFANNPDFADVKLKDSVYAADSELKDDSVIIAGLRKVYKQRSGGICKKNTVKRFEAVKGLYFGVKKAECFGFLGVNGAGKTTTLSTMTGAQYPSTGTAFISGYDIVRQQLKCRRYIGYVPQFDALFDLLNCEEHLKFYGMLKGLKKPIYNKQMNILLNSLTLNKYRTRLSQTYSGGNKRKLSVAIAMIGNPPVIFLDEPSTGMDPVSRRAMWTFISSTMKQRCVILTTHSMEECEALCQRIGIMVNGQLQCIGNTQHLKSRFGDGYQLNMDLLFEGHEADTDSDCESNIKDILVSITKKLKMEFGESVQLIEKNGNRLSYEVPFANENKDTFNKLGQMFDILERMKNSDSELYKGTIDSYALSQTSLEQVFLRMAKKGEELKQLQWERELKIMNQENE